MKKIILLSLVLLSSCGLSGKKQELDVTPQPGEVSFAKGSFNFKGAGFNYDGALEKRTINAIAALADDISAATGKTCSIAATAGIDANAEASALKGVFFLQDTNIAAENYRMEICHKGIKITASDHNGFLYAVQTLRQMLPAGNYKGLPGGSYSVPCCTIKDGPRFGYRGFMIDCSRHFFQVEEIKKCLDIMAVYKINRMHWHLTDDQGWRIEIKKYPELTEVGAFRNGTMIKNDFDTNDGIRYGGFYTQEQIRDIVDYAWNLGITIVPEIDLPGHMMAALTAYPSLGCTGGQYEVATIWGVMDDVLCVGKEKTFGFLEDVLGEVCDLFPSKYIHIGGDECPKVRWEKCPDCMARIKALGLKSDDKGTKEQKLQNYVTARMQKFLSTRGRQIIGWDEILEGELQPGATVMSWRGTKGGIEAANRGFDVIMTPTSYFYFDYQQDDPKTEPFGPPYRKEALDIRKVYSFDPYDQINVENQMHILGVQANLWTEYIDTPEHLEYMMLPRMLALSEVQWCTPEKRNFERFNADLHEHQFKVMDVLGFNYYKKK